MRCKACDKVMTSDEMVIRVETGEFEDLCRKCQRASHYDDDTYEMEIEVGIIKRKYKWDE